MRRGRSKKIVKDVEKKVPANKTPPSQKAVVVKRTSSRRRNDEKEVKTQTNTIAVQQESPKVVKKQIATVVSMVRTVESSSDNVTQKDSEIKSSILNTEELAKVAEYIRRSVSKTFSTTHTLRQSHTPTTTEHSRLSRSISRSIYDYDDDYEDDNYSKAEFSDNEEIIIQNKFSSINRGSIGLRTPLISSIKCRLLPVPKEFGGFWGIFFLILTVPLFVIYIQWCCDQKACELKTFDITKLWNLQLIHKIFLFETVQIYLAFVTAIFILSAIIFGRYEKLPTDRPECKRHFNVLSLGLLTTIGFLAAEYLKYPIANYVLRYYLHFCTYGIVNALIVAFWCYLRANYETNNVQSNPYGKTQNFIIDYSLGKQINPKWFGIIEIKQIYYRISLLATLLLAEIYLYKSIHLPILSTTQENMLQIEKSTDFSETITNFFNNIRFESTTLLSSGMLFCYVLDSILFEHHLVSSFELQHEGVGAFLLLRYAASPFLLTSVTKYAYEHGPFNLPIWFCYLNLVIFFTGLLIKRLSNYIKYRYRIEPTDPRFDKINTIHTFEGRRLLLGRFWGCVRQPNYAGDIVALFGISLPLIGKFSWPPMICILLLVVLLLHRAIRVSTRNASRYNASWVRYCVFVRDYIVPKVY